MLSDEIKRLHELHQAGALSDAEYEQAKARILSGAATVSLSKEHGSKDSTSFATHRDDLLSGRVLLQQGRWQADGSVTGCDGQRRQAEFDAGEQQQILRQQRLARGALNVAWLEAPAGTQLLLVTADDLCLTAPKEADF